MAPADTEPKGLPDLGDSLDETTFTQILEMDEDDDDHEFSSSIVFGFFDQAENTFEDMDRTVEEKDLERLSQQGHFLKGSSATLGLVHMRDCCEKIQHLGHCMDETGTEELEPDECLTRIKKEITKLRAEYITCKRGLQAYFGDRNE